MSTSQPTAIWQGAFTLFGISVQCAVLPDGKRVIEAESFTQLLKAMAVPGAECSPDELPSFAKWQRGEA